MTRGPAAGPVFPVRRMDTPLGLITGASGGIGEAVARRFAPTFDLFLGGRNLRALERLAEQLGGAHARPWQVDLTAHDALSAATRGIERLDLLVHSAGTAEVAAVADTTPDMWRRTLETNLIAVAELTRLLLPALRAARGHVVLINSTVGRFTSPDVAAYAASKFGLRAFADCLRREEAGHGVKVCSVFPGRVDTNMQRRLIRAQAAGPYRPENYLTPGAVANAVWAAVHAAGNAVIDEITVRPLDS